VLLTSFGVCGATALAAIVFCFASDAALAQQGPAVSGLNGKIEFDAGALSLPTPNFMARAAGTLTVPLGDRFGFQADASIASAPGFTASAALHLFTRDPQAYLIGGTLGLIRTPGAYVVAAGPEAELYLDRWTLEAWAGVSITRPTAPTPVRVGPFLMADLAYYLSDNARLSVGISSLDGYSAIQVGGEYLFDAFEMPVALTGETRIGQDGVWRGMIGLRAYIGGENKTLIRRQREDDPADRGSALYTAVGGSTLMGTGSTPPPSAGSSAPPAGGSPSSTPQNPDEHNSGADDPGDNPPPADTGGDHDGDDNEDDHEDTGGGSGTTICTDPNDPVTCYDSGSGGDGAGGLNDPTGGGLF
jgi:hypothetical protein